MARTTRTTVLANILGALANEGHLEKNGNCIELVAHQFELAGVKITSQDIRDAVDAVAEVCPSSFLAQPAVSTHYGPWGMEYRFRPSAEVQQATRDAIKAVYAVTDTMDRTPTTIEIGRKPVEIETVRPRAFATAMGHLRIRWANGDFTVPSAKTIAKWVGVA